MQACLESKLKDRSMKTLIAEDDFTSRLFLRKILEPYGPCQLAADGWQAMEYIRTAQRLKKYYDLICLDIMMPRMDGLTVLKNIRDLEKEQEPGIKSRAKIVMTTALADRDNVIKACKHQCDGYIIKPIDKKNLLDTLKNLGLIPATGGDSQHENPHR